jgi:hypothetical protein
MVESALLQIGPLAEPGTVEPVLLAAGAPLVVHELGDRVQQAPGGALGRLQFRTMGLAFVHRLHLLEGALVRQAQGRIGMGVRLAQHLEEVVHRLVALDLALRQRLHAVHEAVPLRDRDTQLLLDRWASKLVLWGTLMALLAPLRAIERVLLQTTRIVVGVAVVASVPSQEVASSR